jgi:hypothetical protein
MNVDCTLNSFAVPGFSGLDPNFGTKKPTGETISSREEHANISMVFDLMRPHVINESSTTTEVEASSVFDITAPGITLEISEAAYNLCKAHIINSSVGAVSILINETETISLFCGEILDLEFTNGKWRRKSPKEGLRMLGAFGFVADDPIVASTANVNTATGGLMNIDGVALAAGNRVLLKNQTDPSQNGYWIAQSGQWNRDPSYSVGNSTAFTNKYISPKQGGQKGRLFYLVEDDYTIGKDALDFLESAFSVEPIPGKILIYNRNSTDRLMTVAEGEKLAGIQAGAQVNPGAATTGAPGLMSATDKIKLNGIQTGAQANPGAATPSAIGLMSAEDKTKLDKLIINAHADMVDGVGRDLRLVFGIVSTDPAVYIPQIMAEIQRRCNNSSQIDSSGIPDFTGIEIGDYIDGLDLSAIPAENGGTAGQAWNNTYKNNRIVVSGFNTYKNMGSLTNTKNHVLFTFRNIPLKKRMNASNDNAGGYRASELRAFLEGTAGNGTGDMSGVTTAAFLNALKSKIGNYLYTVNKDHSTKSGSAWANYTVWPVSEIEMFGVPVFGDEGVYMVAITSPTIAARASQITPIHIPLYQKSYVYRVKLYNGSKDNHWLQTPYAAGATYFVCVYNTGMVNGNGASGVCGVAPAFCVA